MAEHGYEPLSTQSHGAGMLKFDTVIAKRSVRA